MNILWIKDGKIGHEKQVKTLLDELSKIIDINVVEKEYIIGPFQRAFDIFDYAIGLAGDTKAPYPPHKQKNIDLIIGAGSNVNVEILNIKYWLKKWFNKDVLAVSILVPNYFKENFDIVCAPKHDRHKLAIKHDVIFFEGSLAKVSTVDVDENIGLIAIGGKNKHYLFNIEKILEQIEFAVSLYPSKTWHIFPSRRTPENMLKKLRNITKTNNKILVSKAGFDEILARASIKIITQDSMNMVYESLSTKGSTLLFNMKYLKKNKVINQMNELLHNKQVGYIEYNEMVKGLNKIKIHMPNPHNEVFAEVEKLAYKLVQKIKDLTKI